MITLGDSPEISVQERLLHKEQSIIEIIDSAREVSREEFEKLITSHRRMKNIDVGGRKIRVLQDLDTEELFKTDGRRLLTER